MDKDKFLKPVSNRIIIKTNTQRVWEVISKPGILEYCHPFCESNPVDIWLGETSVDYVVYYNGLKFQRVFTDWLEGVGYELIIGRVNGRKSKVIWRINKYDQSSSELSITIYPHHINEYPSIIRKAIYTFYVKPMLHKYLRSVLKGFQLYIIEGKPVNKNHFGSHSWFSK